MKRIALGMSLFCILVIYLLFVGNREPYVGIQIEEQAGSWVIVDIYDSKWAQKADLHIGDQVIAVNGEELVDGGIGNIIRSASTLTIMRDKVIEIKIRHRDVLNQLLFTGIFPFIYFIITVICCIYLLKKRPMYLFILFLLTVCLAYCSVGNSVRYQVFGKFIIENCVVLCFALLIHFLRNYINELDPKVLFPKHILPIYSLSIVMLGLSIGEIFYPDTLYSFNGTFVLSIVCVYMLFVLFLLGKSYVKIRKNEIVVIFLCVAVPFIPFVVLFALPKTLVGKYIMSSEIAALFFLLVPFLILFIQVPERLFHLDYHVSKLRNYLFYTTLMTVWFIVVISVVATVSISEMVVLAVFLFSSFFLFFYVKERFDFAHRKVMFSPKGDYLHFVYSTIEQIGKMMTVDELLHTFSQHLEKHLKIDKVRVNRVDIAQLNDEYALLKVGELKKQHNNYIGCLYQSAEQKYILHMENANLRREELISLELLMRYIYSFIENTQLVEDLVADLQKLKQPKDVYPAWLDKVVWLQLEQEKSELAQELHDTVLQEQIHVIRLLEGAWRDETKGNSVVQSIHEQLIDINKQLRLYCEKLKPPLLDTLGLQAALNKLFRETAKKADFTLIHDIDKLQLDDPQMPLLVYRILQEMLNNALRHSQATYVKIDVKKQNTGFDITYMDNGVGCDVTALASFSTMGLKGMKERVHACNGTIEIDSYPEEGMQIYISFRGEEK
ncbi:MAG: ATP-binding protein [Lysinibacillus sp.]